MVKSVKVHDDTHRALKRLKTKSRSSSIDEVIRQMIRDSTGVSVAEGEKRSDTQLTSYLKP